MGRTADERYDVRIEGHEVSVSCSSASQPVEWTLSIDGDQADRRKAAGDFTLRGTLADGSEVEAFVHRTAAGPTHVSIRHAGDEVAASRGFTA